MSEVVVTSETIDLANTLHRFVLSNRDLLSVVRAVAVSLNGDASVQVFTSEGTDHVFASGKRLTEILESGLRSLLRLNGTSLIRVEVQVLKAGDSRLPPL